MRRHDRPANRAAGSTLVRLDRAQNDGFNVQIRGNGGERDGTCYVDPGGPVFLRGAASNTIVTVTSFGVDALWQSAHVGYRVDRPAVLEWLASHPAADDAERRGESVRQRRAKGGKNPFKRGRAGKLPGES